MNHLKAKSRPRKQPATILLTTLLLLFGANAVSAKTINALTTQDLKIALGQQSTSDQSKVAAPGDTIILTAGASYDGPFILPNLSNPNNLTITIQSSQLSSLPAGQRVQPADESHMPKLVSPGLGAPALKTAAGASHYKILGVEFTFPDADGLTIDGVVVYNLILLGDPAYTSESDLPDDLTFDRCYAHGRPTRPSQRGIALHTKETWITNSYVSDIHWDQGEAQGISGYNGKGPYHIINNYVEASGENILFGGSPPNIQGAMADGVEVRRNYLYKSPSWHPSPTGYCGGSLWVVKDLFELKSAKNVVVDGNLMENNWGCLGYGAINLTVRNDSPSGNKNSWATIQNVTISNNVIRHVNFGINILGLDDNGQLSVQGHDLVITNNLFEDIRNVWGDGSSARWIQLNSMNNLTLTHNTVFADYGIIGVSGQVNGAKMTGFVMKDNVVTRGSYGIGGLVGGGYVEGQSVLETYFTSPPFDHNLIVDGDSSFYTSYSTLNAWPALSAVGFVDYTSSTPNYRLATGTTYKNTASDGKDPGVDFDALAAAMGTAVSNTVVSDTFTDTAGTLLSSHTGEVGATWTKHPSYANNAYISNSNRLRPEGDSLYYASGVPASADYDVQADLVSMAQAASATGVAGRVSTTGNDAYRVIFDVPNTGGYVLQKVNAGVVTQLQAVGPWQWGGNFADGSTHTIKLQMRGTSIKVFVDGVERMSVTDSSITAAGRAGVYTRGYTMTETWGIHIDNFLVTNAAPPTPTQFVSDTFTDTSGLLLSSHTGETGATWTKHASYSNNSYISNANRMSGGGDSLYYASGAPASADYDVQADLVAMAQGASTTGVVGRLSTSGDNAYRVIFDVPNTGKYLLQKVNAGVVTQLQAVGPWEWGGNFADGSTHSIKLQMRGTSIKVFVDGVERMSVTDSSVTAAGRAGVYTRSYSMTDTWGIHIDNFTATNAP